MARTNTSKIKILEAAADCFSEKGYYSSSVDDIVDRAGVAKGSFYYNFKSKEAILYAVIEWGLDIINQETQKILETSGENRSILYDLLTLYADLVLEYPELASVIFTSHVDYLSPQWRDKIKGLTNLVLIRLAELLEEGAREGFLKETDYPMAAAGLFGMVWNSCDYFIKNRKGRKKEELYTVLFDTFCHGIVKGELG